MQLHNLLSFSDRQLESFRSTTLVDTGGLGRLKWLGRGLLPLNREACEGLVDWVSLQWRSATPSLTVSGLTLDANANQEKGYYCSSERLLKLNFLNPTLSSIKMNTKHHHFLIRHHHVS